MSTETTLNGIFQKIHDRNRTLIFIVQGIFIIDSSFILTVKAMTVLVGTQGPGSC